MKNEEAHSITVLVLRGGPSRERQVSLAGGAAVAAALRKAGYQVLEADILPDDLSALEEQFDVVFPVLHGTFGEDGQLQEILAARHIPFVGTDARGSRLAMNKHLTKKVCREAGIPAAPDKLLVAEDLNEADTHPAFWRAIVGQIGLPCVVKPNEQGSSVGVSIARDTEHLETAVRQSIHDFGDALVESFITGSEFTVGIIGDTPLPILEIKPAKGFYDFHAKYEANNTSYIFDVDLPAEKIMELQADALKAFKTLGCRHLARIDFLMDNTLNHYLLEANTLPGFTDHSLVPKAAGQTGHTMPSLCGHIVQMALHQPI